ncbi:hypothetical protein A3B85_02770 [Candidatus Nomurabacteria bacterium RIFCSPHIGHO2_02_FULL_37_13]|uniref:YiaAB two helix domain-containing protein n=1 Tax=Candidatus Nomurabacteria bacterium RIFCSPHIGHO2_02_FULL_37_13 TaxID=1801750 RepID=A0A1F6W772_9BACT|nr:MAG: hypothetical protein A2640_01250 [Candidatus Nomurabacteria bacterium RIFCSPHIGHO2_01_FULL_36_23]OGI77652.1 MAG: hypothetical protein A3B85_02770 [Candidatus Nomurabacteria bacterium RIFCSPHIGHO2_02_FULL_37_13]OGI88258.1 MAG: hypothetical protein A2906_01745 [Candidatus Nomurabacteria bacterium RIFCSPLOWO2_01_FULL_37_25]
MRKMRTLMILGIWVAVLPYLGFPTSWKTVFFTLSGFGLMYFSYMMYKESKMKETEEIKTFDNFSENHNFSENKATTEECIKPKEEKI